MDNQDEWSLLGWNKCMFGCSFLYAVAPRKLSGRMDAWGRVAPKHAYVIEMCVHFCFSSALIRPKKNSQLLITCSPTPLVEEVIISKAGASKLKVITLLRGVCIYPFSRDTYTSGAIMWSESISVGNLFLCIFRAVVLLHQKPKEDQSWSWEITLTKHLLQLLLSMLVYHRLELASLIWHHWQLYNSFFIMKIHLGLPCRPWR